MISCATHLPFAWPERASSGAHARTTPPEGSKFEATALPAKLRLNFLSVGTKRNQAPWLVSWNSAACELVAPEFTGNMLCSLKRTDPGKACLSYH